MENTLGNNFNSGGIAHREKSSDDGKIPFVFYLPFIVLSVAIPLVFLAQMSIEIDFVAMVAAIASGMTSLLLGMGGLLVFLAALVVVFLPVILLYLIVRRENGADGHGGAFPGSERFVGVTDDNKISEQKTKAA